MLDWFGRLIAIGVIGLFPHLAAGEPVPAGSAETAIVNVHVDAPDALRALPLVPELCQAGTPVSVCFANSRALTPYAVIAADLLVREEAEQRARAAATKGLSPVLTLPAQVHRPANAPEAESPAGARDYTAAVPAGCFDLRIDLGEGGAQWWSNLSVNAGAFVKGVTVETPGSVRITWTIDAPLYPPVSVADPASLAELLERLQHVAMVGLIRDGRVWAVGRMLKDTEYWMPRVPPGTYTLVLRNRRERFLYVDPKVAVTAGQETRLTAQIRRADQAGLGLTYYDPSRNRYAPINNLGRVYDPNLGVAFEPTAQVHKSESAGGLAAEFTVSEYGGLLATGLYRLDCRADGFRAITGQAVAATRVPRWPSRQGEEVPAEDYKTTIIRLQLRSAIAGPPPPDPSLRNFFMRPVAAP